MQIQNKNEIASSYKSKPNKENPFFYWIKEKASFFKKVKMFWKPIDKIKEIHSLQKPGKRLLKFMSIFIKILAFIRKLKWKAGLKHLDSLTKREILMVDDLTYFPTNNQNNFPFDEKKLLRMMKIQYFIS